MDHHAHGPGGMGQKKKYIIVYTHRQYAACMCVHNNVCTCVVHESASSGCIDEEEKSKKRTIRGILSI